MSNNKTVPNSEIEQYVEEYNQILFYQRRQLEKMTEVTGRATMLQTIKKNEDILNCLNELLETRKESREIADEAYKKGLQDGKEAAELAKPIYIYKTVRSYTDNCRTQNNELITALKEGFEFVRASEVVKKFGQLLRFYRIHFAKRNCQHGRLKNGFFNWFYCRVICWRQSWFDDCGVC